MLPIFYPLQRGVVGGESPSHQRRCYLDEYPSMSIERIEPAKPAFGKPEFEFPFRRESAVILKTLLQNPSHPWRVEELAESTNTSLSHVADVTTHLLSRGWGEQSSEGLFLAKPKELIDAWRDAYEAPPGTRLTFRSNLHGKEYDLAEGAAIGDEQGTGRRVLASFSAARWLTMFVSTTTHYYYADEAGLESLKTALQLSATDEDPNVIITIPTDPALLNEAIELFENGFCSSPIQTYLDLWVSGESAREAAQTLRDECVF